MSWLGGWLKHEAPGLTGTTLWQVVWDSGADVDIVMKHQIRHSSYELGKSFWADGADKRDFPKEFLMKESTPWEFVDAVDLPLLILGSL